MSPHSLARAVRSFDEGGELVEKGVSVAAVDAREAFRKPFVDVARTRYARIEEAMGAAASPDLAVVVSELHTLSGEAAMLDFGAVADLSRVAEDAARSGEIERLNPLLRELSSAILAVERGGME